MSVIAEMRIPSSDFELGRILDLGGGGEIRLETMVPLGQSAVPFLRLDESVAPGFIEQVSNHPSVRELHAVSADQEHGLYALDWDVSRDLLFEGLSETGAQLLRGRGSATEWHIELRFDSHEALSAFQQHCEDAQISLTVDRIYNPTKPESGPYYGLTPPQRETLVRAVDGGYYSIPRRISTGDLAEEFDISDQAVTERLRRAIVTLVENTLMVEPDE